MAGEDLSWTPGTCRNGHPMGPGRSTLSWTPCTCPASGTPPWQGHHNVHCGTCGDEHRPPGCNGPIDPPHNGTGNPGDRGYPA